MSEQEAIAYIEEWDATEAAKVLKWYEGNELLRPCDCDTIVAIETVNLQAENAKLRELAQALYEFAYTEYPDSAELNFAERMRELGVEVDE